MIEKNVPWISVNNICSILDILKRFYYNALKDKTAFDSSSRVPPSQQLLKDHEEELILLEIAHRQMPKDCMTGQDIRDIAKENLS